MSAALIATVRIEEVRLSLERRRATAAVLAESNRSAERDTTRDVARENARVAKLLGDSLRVIEKQVVQVAQKRDELDRVLGRERAARYAATASVDSLSRLLAAGVVATNARGAPDGEVRAASFRVRQEPYTVVADVEFPPAPDSARMKVRVAVDPIPIEARVTCASVGGSAREANVSVKTPAWVAVRIGTVSQSPEVCAVPAHAQSPVFRLLSLAAPRILAGAGRAWSIDGRGRWVVFVGAGFGL